MAMSILLFMLGILHFAHGQTEYVVYPTDKENVTACSQINDALVNMLGDNEVQIYQSQVRFTTEFWFIKALENQKEDILEIPGVRIPYLYLHHLNNIF